MSSAGKPSSPIDHILSLKSSSAKTYWTKVFTFVRQEDKHGSTVSAYKELFDGPVWHVEALYYLAGVMGLISMQGNQIMPDAPILFAIKSRAEGSNLEPQDPAAFIGLVTTLLADKKLLPHLMDSIVEFHDFLKIVDEPQAKQFVSELVKSLFQRTGDLAHLLAYPGSEEDLTTSIDYGGTLRRALEEQGLFDQALKSLLPKQVSSALLRLQWRELLVIAPSKGKDNLFSQHLGL